MGNLYSDREGNLYERVGAGGCIGGLALLIIGFVLYFFFNLGTFAYKRYTDRQIDSRLESQRVEVAPATLDSYAGQYDYGRYRIKIEHRGNKLFNISDEEFCELMPISTDEFIYKNCVLGFHGRAKFVRDMQGRLTLVVIHQDGREERAPRLK
jgi:hypothetical protein